MLIRTLPIDDAMVRSIGETTASLRAPRLAAFRPGTRRTLGMAHPIFTLGLEALLGGDPTPRLVGMRVLEWHGDEPKALFDLATDDRVLRRMTSSPRTVQRVEDGLEAISGLPEDAATPPELRSLNIPALNFEALWLHGETEERDQLVPLQGFHGFTPLAVVGYREALERLRGPAEMAREQDDAMGA